MLGCFEHWRGDWKDLDDCEDWEDREDWEDWEEGREPWDTILVGLSVSI